MKFNEYLKEASSLKLLKKPEIESKIYKIQYDNQKIYDKYKKKNDLWSLMDGEKEFKKFGMASEWKTLEKNSNILDRLRKALDYWV